MHEVNGNDNTGKMHISWRHSRSKKKKQQQCHEVHEFHCRNFTIFREIQLPDEMSGINPHLLLQTRSHEGFKSCNLVDHRDRPLTVV